MRKALLLLAVLGSTSSLWAADPIIGTWKLNLEKSKLLPNDPLNTKEMIETYRELSGNQIELTWKNITKDGSSSVTVMTYPIQGGAAKILEGDNSSSLIQTKIAQNEWIVTYLRDGKQVFSRHKKISKDGKILRQTLRGIDDEGKPYEVLLVCDKQ